MGKFVDFKVTTKVDDVVTAAMPLQDHLLTLSNLDYLLPPLDVNVFFCYKNSVNDILLCDDEEILLDQQQIDNIDNKNNTFKYRVSVLKKALAQALAYFYPFAGKVVENSAGEPEILCNNRGVVFVEAFADVELCELDLHNPDQSVEGKLVPKKKDAVFSVQVTELKCGGIVVACAFDHRVADAYSANMFLVTWAEMATSKPISTTPYFRRSLINPRRPLDNNQKVENNDSFFDDMFLPISLIPNPSQHQDEMDPLVTRIYLVTKDQLNNLQSLCSEGLDKVENGSCKRKSCRSKLQSFSAFLWQIVASHACQLEEENVNKITRMGIVVDGRTRLSDGESKENAQAFASYFGNVLSVPFGEQKCGDLKEMPITITVEFVHKFLERAMTKDHFLGLVDWVEARRPEPAITKIYCTQEGDGPAFVVSSGLRFPVSKMDFGWGKPTFGSYHFPWGGSCGYVMPMPSPSENGDWIVYMHLTKNQLDFIEAHASHVFKPFSLHITDFKQ